MSGTMIHCSRSRSHADKASSGHLSDSLAEGRSSGSEIESPISRPSPDAEGRQHERDSGYWSEYIKGGTQDDGGQLTHLEATLTADLELAFRETEHSAASSASVTAGGSKGDGESSHDPRALEHSKPRTASMRSNQSWDELFDEAISECKSKPSTVPFNRRKVDFRAQTSGIERLLGGNGVDGTGEDLTWTSTAWTQEPAPSGGAGSARRQSLGRIHVQRPVTAACSFGNLALPSPTSSSTSGTTPPIDVSSSTELPSSNGHVFASLPDSNNSFASPPSFSGENLTSAKRRRTGSLEDDPKSDCKRSRTGPFRHRGSSVSTVPSDDERSSTSPPPSQTPSSSEQQEQTGAESAPYSSNAPTSEPSVVPTATDELQQPSPEAHDVVDSNGPELPMPHVEAQAYVDNLNPAIPQFAVQADADSYNLVQHAPPTLAPLPVIGQLPTANRTVSTVVTPASVPQSSNTAVGTWNITGHIRYFAGESESGKKFYEDNPSMLPHRTRVRQQFGLIASQGIDHFGGGSSHNRQSGTAFSDTFPQHLLSRNHDDTPRTIFYGQHVASTQPSFPPAPSRPAQNILSSNQSFPSTDFTFSNPLVHLHQPSHDSFAGWQAGTSLVTSATPQHSWAVPSSSTDNYQIPGYVASSSSTSYFSMQQGWPYVDSNGYASGLSDGVGVPQTSHPYDGSSAADFVPQMPNFASLNCQGHSLWNLTANPAPQSTSATNVLDSVPTPSSNVASSADPLGFYHPAPASADVVPVPIEPQQDATSSSTASAPPLQEADPYTGLVSSDMLSQVVSGLPSNFREHFSARAPVMKGSMGKQEAEKASGPQPVMPPPSEKPKRSAARRPRKKKDAAAPPPSQDVRSTSEGTSTPSSRGWSLASSSTSTNRRSASRESVYDPEAMKVCHWKNGADCLQPIKAGEMIQHLQEKHQLGTPFKCFWNGGAMCVPTRTLEILQKHIQEKHLRSESASASAS